MFTPSFSYESGKGRERELEQRREKQRLLEEARDPALTGNGSRHWAARPAFTSEPEGGHTQQPQPRLLGRFLRLLLGLLPGRRVSRAGSA